MQEILAALAGAATGLNQAVMAVSFGFAMFPTALAYVVGIIAVIAFGSTIPISFQAETLVMAGTLGKDIRERLSMIMFAGLGMTLIGIFGLLDSIIGFAGNTLISAMMAGVGIVLGKIAFDMAKSNKPVGITSILVAVITYFITKSVPYTCIITIVVSVVIGKVMKQETAKNIVINDEFKLQKPTINANIIRGTLALMCLTIGGNIAATGIGAAIAGVEPNPDQVSIYSGLADFASALFGGSPISVVIAPTSATPHPLIAAIIMMGIMALVLFTKTLPKLIKHIPSSTVAGLLFLFGPLLTLPPNLGIAYSGTEPGNAISCSVTLAVTAVSDPFLGLLAGIITRALVIPLGLA